MNLMPIAWKNLPLHNDFYVFFLSAHKEYTTKFYSFSLFLPGRWALNLELREGLRKDYFSASFFFESLLCFIAL